MVLPWASIPLLAIHFVSTWNELPARIATHFDLQGRANGWQSPQMLAAFAFGSLILALSIFTAVLLRAFRLRSMTRALMVFEYLIVGTNFTLFWQLLDHAAFGRLMSQVWPVPVLFPLLALGLAITLISSSSPEAAGPSSQATIIKGEQRRPSSQATIIAKEQHRSLLQLLFIIPGALIGLWLAGNGIGVLRVLGLFLIAVMGWVAIAVLDGFRYIVRTDGVQVRGF